MNTNWCSTDQDERRGPAGNNHMLDNESSPLSQGELVDEKVA